MTNKVTFHQVNKWSRLAKKPLKDEQLEAFQEEFFGEFRHYYYRFFYHMVAEMKPKIALEIGIDHGHALAHMAKGNPGTIAVGIEKRVNCASNMPVCSNVHLIYQNSLEAEKEISELVREYGPVGVVFQDSSHHYLESHKEFDLYSQYLDKNAVWCVDDVMDVFHDPAIDPVGKSMASYFSELPGRKKLYPDLHHGSVIGVSLL